MITKNSKKLDSPVLSLLTRKELRKVYLKGKFVSVAIEINENCNGGCTYCYASSVYQEELPNDNLSLNKFKEILAVKKFGVKVVLLYGGDQLLHPHCKEMVFHALDEGFHVYMPLAGLISKQQAEWLVEAQKFARSRKLEFFVSIHIDSLDQQIYNQVNRFPETLQAKIKGYQNLLKAGFPRERIYGCPTITNQTAGTMIDTMNWFYGKGARHVALMVFRPIGLGKKEAGKWEPTLSQLKKIFEYRGSIEGKNILIVGCSDGKWACHSGFSVLANGDVVPCLLLPDLSVGNIYKENILDIVKRGKKQLQLEVNIKGPCASCVSRFVCYGCRASAYSYCGDLCASDPKCFYNPDAKEKYF